MSNDNVKVATRAISVGLMSAGIVGNIEYCIIGCSIPVYMVVICTVAGLFGLWAFIQTTIERF